MKENFKELVASELRGLRAKYNYTQKEVAEVTNVTEVTIRNRYSEITKLLDIKLSDY